MFHLISHGRENLQLLRKELFTVQVDAAGKKFVFQVADNLDKSHAANHQPDDSPGKGRTCTCMNEGPESCSCPVKTFELYLSKLNPALSCLRQRLQLTENFSHSDEGWHCNVPTREKIIH